MVSSAPVTDVLLLPLQPACFALDFAFLWQLLLVCSITKCLVTGGSRLVVQGAVVDLLEIQRMLWVCMPTQMAGSFLDDEEEELCLSM